MRLRILRNKKFLELAIFRISHGSNYLNWMRVFDAEDVQRCVRQT